MHTKLALVPLLIGDHACCGKRLGDFRRDDETRPQDWFRWFNETTVLVLVAAAVLVVVKPF